MHEIEQLPGGGDRVGRDSALDGGGNFRGAEAFLIVQEEDALRILAARQSADPAPSR